MSSPPTSTWQDRRGMFQKGREVHPSDRRSSTSSTGGIVDTVRQASISSISSIEKAISPSSPDKTTTAKGPPSPELASSPPTSTAQRRRSSNQGLFGNLMTHKRGGEDYGQRRASHTEQYTSGVFSGWYGKTFRGAMGPGATADETKKQESGLVEPAAAPTGTRRESVPAVWEDRRALFQKGRER